MEPAMLAWMALGLGVLCATVAWAIDRRTWPAAPGKSAQDHAIIGWWALTASATLSSAQAALILGGASDLALLTTVRSGAVLVFLLAAASFIMSAAHAVTASAAVKYAPPARRPS